MVESTKANKNLSSDRPKQEENRRIVRSIKFVQKDRYIYVAAGKYVHSNVNIRNTMRHSNDTNDC